MSYMRVRRAAETNTFYSDAVNRVVGYRQAWAIADQAAKRLEDLASNAEPEPVSPLQTGVLDDDWIEHQVDRQLSATDAEARRLILTQLRDSAHTRVSSLVNTNVDLMLTSLHDSLVGVLDKARELVADLDGATSPAEAINAGAKAAAAWAGLSAVLKQYDQVRMAQAVAMAGHPDAIQQAKSSANLDARATDLIMANLDDVSPSWRAPRLDYSGVPVWAPPWPDGHTEFVVWACTGEAQLWVPTIRQLQQLWDGRAPALTQTTKHPAPPSPPTVHDMLARSIR